MSTEYSSMQDDNVNMEQNNENEDNSGDGKIWLLDQFEIGDCLGNGKFGYVYKAVEKNSKKEVAIKLISKKIVAQYEFFEQLKNEIEIHTRLMYDIIYLPINP
jgi:serine/threonine protein kinase